jgi:CBS domain-containing protein
MLALGALFVAAVAGRIYLIARLPPSAEQVAGVSGEEALILELVNRERAKANLPPLKLSGRLAVAARLQEGQVVQFHVRDAMTREFATVDSHQMLEPALATLRDCKCRSLPVLHDGQLVGLLTVDNVGEFLMIQAALRHRQARQTRTMPSHLPS